MKPPSINRRPRHVPSAPTVRVQVDLKSRLQGPHRSRRFPRLPQQPLDNVSAGRRPQLKNAPTCTCDGRRAHSEGLVPPALAKAADRGQHDQPSAWVGTPNDEGLPEIHATGQRSRLTRRDALQRHIGRANDAARRLVLWSVARTAGSLGMRWATARSVSASHREPLQLPICSPPNLSVHTNDPAPSVGRCSSTAPMSVTCC